MYRVTNQLHHSENALITGYLCMQVFVWLLYSGFACFTLVLLEDFSLGV